LKAQAPIAACTDCNVKEVRVSVKEDSRMAFAGIGPVTKEKTTMKIIDRFYVLFLAVLVLLTLPLVDGHRPAFAENPQLSTVAFYVQ
jgi:hypothetical protein